MRRSAPYIAICNIIELLSIPLDSDLRRVRLTGHFVDNLRIGGFHGIHPRHRQRIPTRLQYTEAKGCGAKQYRCRPVQPDSHSNRRTGRLNRRKLKLLSCCRFRQIGRKIRSVQSLSGHLLAHTTSLGFPCHFRRGPIYDDVLAVRIARAHGKDRTEPVIRNLALGAVESRFPCTQEDGRTLFWPEDAILDTLVYYRKSVDGLRAHSDISFSELASIALPFIRPGLAEEALLQIMADIFGLVKLRHVGRKRFLSAPEMAKRTYI